MKIVYISPDMTERARINAIKVMIREEFRTRLKKKPAVRAAGKRVKTLNSNKDGQI